MNEENVIQLAKKAGLIDDKNPIDQKKVLKFAELLKNQIFEELKKRVYVEK
jgi:hypothetical protein